MMDSQTAFIENCLPSFEAAQRIGDDVEMISETVLLFLARHPEDIIPGEKPYEAQTHRLQSLMYPFGADPGFQQKWESSNAFKSDKSEDWMIDRRDIIIESTLDGFFQVLFFLFFFLNLNRTEMLTRLV